MDLTTATATKPTFEMVTRTCAECKRGFKVLATSKTTTCSRTCMEAQGIPVPKVDWQKAHALKKKLAAKGVEASEELQEAVDKFVDDVDSEESIDENSPPKVSHLKIATKPSPATTQKSIRETSPILSREPSPPAPVVTSLSDTTKEQAAKSNTEPSHALPIVAVSSDVSVQEALNSKGTNKISAESLEVKWAKNVEKAKGCIVQITQCRLEIATLALEVCDVRWGGGAHWNSFEGTYTLKKFAEEVGLNPKTLSNWVRVKRNVHDKLIEAGEEVDPVEDWAAMTRVADRMKHDAEPADVVASFASWDHKKIKAHNANYHVVQMRRKTKTFRSFLEKTEPKKLSRKELGEIHRDMLAIINHIRKNSARFRK